MLTNIFSLLRPLVLYFCLLAKNYSVVKSWSKSILNLVHLHVTIVVTVRMTVEGKGARLTVNLLVIFVILHASRLQDPEIGIIQDIINLRIIGEDLVTTLGKVKNLTLLIYNLRCFQKTFGCFSIDIDKFFNLIRNFAPPPQAVHRTSEPPPSQFKLSITGLPLSVTTHTIRYDKSLLKSNLFQMEF